MDLSLLHEGSEREDGRQGGSEEARRPASMQRDVRRSNEENEQKIQEFLFVCNKKLFSSNKKLFSSNKNKFIFFVAIKSYFRVIKNISFGQIKNKNSTRGWGGESALGKAMFCHP
jgi:hypothetical protein